MPTVTNNELQTAEEIFCKQMGFDADSWHGIFEFAMFLNFSILNVLRKDVRTLDKVELDHRMGNAIKLLSGPHSDTLVQAYKHRRYSLLGRARAAVVMPTIICKFVLVAVIACVFETVGIFK